VVNTPQILDRLSKAATRRMRAAFAKVGLAVLMELGLHNPVAVAIGREGESEMSLAKRLLGSLQKGWLLLADRYYGVGVFVGELLRLKAQRGCEFLVRVKEKLKSKVIEALCDGSLLVELQVAKGHKALVREIRGRVRRRNGTWVNVRLWTSLLDAAKYPALELLALYAQRWEIEIGYRELKVELRGSALLSSHTVETAAQEIAALVLAQAVLVQVRVTAGVEGGVDVLRISFVKVLQWVRTFWLWASVGEDLLTDRQLATCVRRMFAKLTRAVSRPRRARSCPRAVRQPIRAWPRLLKNTQETGPFHYELLPASV
jgi:IS4 transposase